MDIIREIIETNLLSRAMFVLDITQNNLFIDEDEINIFGKFSYNRHTGILETLVSFKIENEKIILNRSDDILKYNLNNSLDFVNVMSIIDAFNIDRIKQWKHPIEYFMDVDYLSWYTDLNNHIMKTDEESRKKFLNTLLKFKNHSFNQLCDIFSFSGDAQYNHYLNDSIENNFIQSKKINMYKICNSQKESYNFFGDYEGASILKSNSLELFLSLAYDFNREPLDLFKEIFLDNAVFKKYYNSGNINDRQMTSRFKDIIKGKMDLPEFFVISPNRYDFSAIFAFTNNDEQDVSFKTKGINKLDFIQKIIEIKNDMNYDNSSKI